MSERIVKEIPRLPGLVLVIVCQMTAYLLLILARLKL
jgi:hypothetical protein